MTDSLKFEIPVTSSSWSVRGLSEDVLLNIPQTTLLTLFGNFYEAAESRFLPTIYDAQDRVLELGSGIGFMTSILGRLVSKVVSFEPMLNYAAIAQSNVELNGLNDKVEVIPAMIGVSTGKIIYHQRAIAYESSALPDRPGYEVDRGEEVQANSLDINEVSSRYDLNAIHMDAEGYEKMLIPHLVLYGKPERVLKLSFEVHTHLLTKAEIRAMFLLLDSCGLHPVGVSGTDEFPDRPFVIAFRRDEVRERMRVEDYSGMGRIDEPEEFIESVRGWE